MIVSVNLTEMDYSDDTEWVSALATVQKNNNNQFEVENSFDIWDSSEAFSLFFFFLFSYSNFKCIVAMQIDFQFNRIGLFSLGSIRSNVISIRIHEHG